MAGKKKQLSESLEDYLEAVYIIENDKGAARAKDVATRLNVKAPSVTGALRVLSEKGLINYAPYDVITLTPKGKRLARDILQRHKTLRNFFTQILSLEAQEADEAACRMEHAISPVILDRLAAFMEFLDSCPLGGEKWLSRFHEFCGSGEMKKDCDACLAESMDTLKKGA